MTEPSVTVVIPVLNEARDIGSCLDAVLAQSYPNIAQILVVDGGSDDDTAKIAGSRPGVTVLQNPNRIQSAGLNIGLASAVGEIVVRVDGHSVLDRGHVERSVRSLRATGAAIVGGVMEPAASSCFGRGVALAMRSRLGVGPARFHRGGSGWVDTVFLGAFRADVARAAGGYSEDVGVNEDAEFAFRMRRFGGVWLDDSLRVQYAPRETPSALARQFFRYGVSRAATVRRHPTSLRSRQLAPPLLVLLLIVGPRRATLATYLALIGGRAAIEARRDPCGAGAMAVAMPLMHLPWAVGFVHGLAGRRL